MGPGFLAWLTHGSGSEYSQFVISWDIQSIRGGLSPLAWGFLEDVGDMAGTALMPPTKMFRVPCNLQQYECERPVFLRSYIIVHKHQKFGIDAI